MNKRLGFTLAEVLITLGIIGVVAAMTIPTLMNQTGQAEFKAGFKKIISTMSQAVTMSVALNSTDFSNLTSGTTAESSVFGMFNTRMNVIKTAVDATGGGMQLGSFSAVDHSGNYTLFFNDGMAISFPNTCGATALTGANLAASCRGYVDVNGVKKPNKLTNCAGSSSAITETDATCSTTNAVITDRFSIRFGAQQISPNGDGARYVMFN